nr:integrase, catalytic region, zinc finger, CCHC-type, peptidase aspartic, catalytic [Tanacetum cinerariifolium]
MSLVVKIAEIVQICLWIIDSGCSKHMTGNRALLTNFMEKFLGTVRFGNNDFAVIVGYGDEGLEVAFHKSTCFVRNEDGVDFLTGDHSSNLYTIALNEGESNSSNCLLAKASSLQSWLWHQRLSHLSFATIDPGWKARDQRAISSLVLEASEVQIPQDDLDNLRLTEEEDGATEILDP